MALELTLHPQGLWGNKVIKRTQKHLQSQDGAARALGVLSYATHTISAPMTQLHP